VLPAQVGADGRFVLAGIPPGLYRIAATVPAAPSGSIWALASAVIDGRDSLDFPLEIRPGQSTTGAIVTFTDRPTELSGTVHDASGRPSAASSVVVFAVDPAFWTPRSRRTSAVRPDDDGKYSFRNLPAGEYLIAAADDVGDGDWFDPAFLDALAPSALRVTLAAGETKVQDLRPGSDAVSRQPVPPGL
jgi:hypothetical protein